MFKIIATTDCPWCQKAKRLLEMLDCKYEIEVLYTPEEKAAFKASGFTTVPQIYRNGEHIGGYSDLVNLIKEGLSWT